MAGSKLPRNWAGLTPMGVGKVKPNHILDIVRAAWENRDELGFATRILRDGVCDGCALGTTGMKDMTLKGIHLCNVRLALLRLNTMPALDNAVFEDPDKLASMNEKELRHLGRLSTPMVRKKGEKKFQRISWDEALRRISERIRQLPHPDRMALYLTSRGLTNEVYYVAQKVARFLGTNNVDNAARLCHAPSTTGLKTTIGYAASTCSYKDWLGTDLLVFIGSNAPNNQPVTTKYMVYAKEKGTKIAVINTYREPGLEKYWVPSVFESAVFGTRLADEFFMVHGGGDLAFLTGTLKALEEKDALKKDFIEEHTLGFEELRTRLKSLEWETLEHSSGSTRQEIERFADMVANARSAIFVWSMGITQHEHGVQNVQAIVNLALSQGFLGRDHCGLMPIRGHSGVQGGAEVGCIPNGLPGGHKLNEEDRAYFAERWQFEVPPEVGMTTVQMVDAAHEGKLDLFYSVGGNFLNTLPEPQYVREALENVPFRVHQDIVLSPQMFVDAREETLLLPAQTRYEQRGGGTETSTERHIYFSPEIPGRRVGESRSEWDILMEVAKRTKPDKADLIHFEDADAIREELAWAVPFYKGIETLKKKGDVIQWGGRHLCKDGECNTPDGKARFITLDLPHEDLPEGWFVVGSRRGKQFNSMIHRDKDPLTGAGRHAIFINGAEAQKMGFVENEEVLLRSETGEMRGTLKFSPIHPRNVQVFWPEGNVLLKRSHVEPQSQIPVYTGRAQLLSLRKLLPEQGETTP